MHLPDIPATSIPEMKDDVLLELFSTLGHLGKVGTRRALAMLPEIAARGLYRKAGASSYFELAKKRTGVSEGVVNRIMALHDKIGHMPELWDLLRQGEEGWSKFEVVQSIATPESAARLAERIQACPRAELAEYVRRLKAQRQGAAVSAATAKPAAQGPCNDTAQQEVGWGQTCGLFEASEPSIEAEGRDQETEHAASPRLRHTVLYLTREDDELLSALQAQYQREHGLAISLGEVVGLLIRSHEAARSGEASARNEGEPQASDRQASDRQACDRPTTPASLPEALPSISSKVVEVVVRVAELGSRWQRRLIGVLPAGLASAFRDREAIEMGDLYLQAIQAAAKAKGDRIPSMVIKYVALRAGLRCGTMGCQAPPQEFDHIKARADGGTHHPDNVTFTCRVGHRMKHLDLFDDSIAGVVADPGRETRSTHADLAFQRILGRAQGVQRHRLLLGLGLREVIDRARLAYSSG